MLPEIYASFLTGKIVATQALSWVALALPDVFSGAFQGDGQPTELFNGPDAVVPRMINILLFIVGVLSIFMIVYGGIRYVFSGGDNTKVKDARNTVLYAVLGLIVALVGYSIVGWVVSVISGSSASSGISV